MHNVVGCSSRDQPPIYSLGLFSLTLLNQADRLVFKGAVINGRGPTLTWLGRWR